MISFFLLIYIFGNFVALKPSLEDYSLNNKYNTKGKINKIII